MIIRFDNVSKIFTRNANQKLIREHVRDFFRRDVGTREFYALKQISFDIQEGESVAIIGSNGAGKSTLLSLVAGLSRPDQGRVQVNGKVAALLELGSGFHPDLTGVENIKLNAALLGFSRKRTAELFDSIVDFAGIGEWIYEPLRTYSTGMVMRLAFSVAINLEPAVLIIDEVLAVGDQAFQEKCFEKIHELRNSGRTMLTVSHSPALVLTLCDRALWLDQGELVRDGGARDVLDSYSGRLLESGQLAASK